MKKDPRASHPDFTPTDPPPAKRTLGAPVERILTRPMPVIELRDSEGVTSNPVIPSKAPGVIQGALAGLGQIPRRERKALLFKVATLATAIVLGMGALFALVTAYMISLGHIPSWLE